ncbi:MAG: tetratricopeptide repeat protein [Desulfarculales bacterium]|jgi:tetratricopeptide (TPR) repeat protein|nr:tetratricopeptide repeat protein [Desulfarculales bacterium]
MTSTSSIKTATLLFPAVLLFFLCSCSLNIPGPYGAPPEFISPQIEPDQALMHFAFSQMRVHEGDSAGASEYLNQAIAMDKNNATLRLELARLAVGDDNLEKAADCLHEAVRLNPVLTEAWILLGGVESTRKNYLQAIKAYKEALRLDPALEDILLVLGILYLDNNQPEEALKPLQTLIKRQPEVHLAHFYLGRAYTAVRQYPAAEKAYLQAMTGDSISSMAEFELAGLYELQNRLAKAEAAYLRLLEANASALVRERLGQLYMRQGKNEAALQQFAILKGLDPDDPEVRIRLGLVLYEQNKYTQSAEEFKLVLNKEPGHRRALYYLGVCLAAQANNGEALRVFAQIPPGQDNLFEDSALQQAQILVRGKRTDQALTLLENALRQRPHSVDLLTGLAMVQEIGNNYSEASAILERAVQLEPNNAELYYRMAVLSSRRHNSGQAIEYLRQAIKINPTCAKALNDLGYSLLEEPDPDLEEAESLIRRALQEEPNRTTILDSMGWVLYLKGQYEDAYEYLLRASQDNDMGDAVIFEHLGDTCVRLGRVQEAVKAYQNALALHPLNREIIQDKIKALKR